MAEHIHHCWRIVSYLEFDQFLRQYPRELIVEPPLDRPARFCSWSDPTLGSWPQSMVTKHFAVHRTGTFEVRQDAVRASLGLRESS